MSFYAVGDDGTSLYDSSYWLDKMLGIYKKSGCKDIDDVILLHYRERAAYWLRYFLMHLLPPARVIEIGCGMGTFSHWLGQLGYEVMATELSPVWRDVVRGKLGINISDYSLGIEPDRAGRFDAVIMMDVLEHILDPATLFKAICNDLKTDGILVIQMPEYDGKTSYKKIRKREHRFFCYLLPKEHVFLYSWYGCSDLLTRHGFTHVQRYPAIFQDDMFLVASRVPLRYVSSEDARKAFMRPETIAAYAALKNYEAGQVRPQWYKALRSFKRKICAVFA
jgi:2-polyprenyl-3-methyl-5-hydroxy-6-metoxy-1,4-benzoquinol methylase